MNGSPNRAVSASSVLVATGLTETLPALPSIRAFYGLGLFSCIECDGYEHSDKLLALIGETSHLASRALLIAQWSHNLIVFTNGVGRITDAQEAVLATRGVRVERRVIAGVYAAGDSTAPGPQQIIVAAGAGARVASAINRDLIGIPRA